MVKIINHGNGLCSQEFDAWEKKILGLDKVIPAATPQPIRQEEFANAVMVQLVEGRERPVVSLMIRDESARPELEQLARRILNYL